MQQRQIWQGEAVTLCMARKLITLYFSASRKHKILFPLHFMLSASQSLIHWIQLISEIELGPLNPAMHSQMPIISTLSIFIGEVITMSEMK